MTLHSELNTKNVSNQNDDYGQVEQTNKELLLKSFIKDYIKNNNSIISDLFSAINSSIFECPNCLTKLYNYQIYFYIIFPLEKVIKYKNKMNNNTYNNILNIYDCFDYDRKINLMKGDNFMYCNYCNKICNFTMITNLLTCPKILIIILNREKEKQSDININLDQTLVLNNYIEFNNNNNNYELIGIIYYIRNNNKNEKYIACCKDLISNNWYKYDDEIVSEVNNFQEEVINFKIPYVLFYQKV